MWPSALKEFIACVFILCGLTICVIILSTIHRPFSWQNKLFHKYYFYKLLHRQQQPNNPLIIPLIADNKESEAIISGWSWGEKKKKLRDWNISPLRLWSIRLIPYFLALLIAVIVLCTTLALISDPVVDDSVVTTTKRIGHTETIRSTTDQPFFEKRGPSLTTEDTQQSPVIPDGVPSSPSGSSTSGIRNSSAPGDLTEHPTVPMATTPNTITPGTPPRGIEPVTGSCSIMCKEPYFGLDHSFAETCDKTEVHRDLTVEIDRLTYPGCEYYYSWKFQGFPVVRMDEEAPALFSGVRPQDATALVLTLDQNQGNVSVLCAKPNLLSEWMNQTWGNLKWLHSHFTTSNECPGIYSLISSWYTPLLTLVHLSNVHIGRANEKELQEILMKVSSLNMQQVTFGSHSRLFSRTLFHLEKANISPRYNDRSTVREVEMLIQNAPNLTHFSLDLDLPLEKYLQIPRYLKKLVHGEFALVLDKYTTGINIASLVSGFEWIQNLTLRISCDGITDGESIAIHKFTSFPPSLKSLTIMTKGSCSLYVDDNEKPRKICLVDYRMLFRSQHMICRIR